MFVLFSFVVFLWECVDGGVIALSIVFFCFVFEHVAEFRNWPESAYVLILQFVFRF